MNAQLIQGAPSSWSLIFPTSTNWESRWAYFQSAQVKRNPFGDLTRQCRDGNNNDLDFDNITLPTERPLSEYKTAYTFVSREERTVSLIAGSVDEATWQLKQAIAYREIAYIARMFPFPDRYWTPLPSDMDRVI
ncbi:hypothetical protein LI328DRAFT_168018 [Trichoderma asperelloides]|nr:hypothetical protein LI328DRAFT_168018 [Trichoderma asperelloides]